MPASTIAVSKGALAMGYAVGAVLAAAVAAIVTLASAAGSIAPSIREHDAADRANWASAARADSAILNELRKQSCILVAETSAEKNDCIKRVFLGP